MRNEHQQPSVTSVVAGKRPSRRAFSIGVASMFGAAAFWSLHHPLSSTVEAKAGKDETDPVTIVQFSPDGKRIGKVSVPRIVKSDAEWQQQLPPRSYGVARKAGTERPFSGEPRDFHERGIFNCICCDTAVFNADTKFESGTGWPSFWQPIAKENVVETTDQTLGMSRTAVSCRRCNAHLGHVFDDGPAPTGLRYCMNWVAMRFVKIA
jgi:peptide-methionine (R)-S-oxide reductase